MGKNSGRLPIGWGKLALGFLLCGIAALAEFAPIPAILQACLRLAVLSLCFAVVAFLVHRFCSANQNSKLQRSRRYLVRRASFVILSILFVEISSLTLMDYLFTRKKDLRRLYNVALKVQPDYVGPAISLNYAGHHYLNYALNPATPYMGTTQYNQRYLIRRSEPIRPREDVAWRTLVLGGSTTFGEQVANEHDTWVHQLEQRVRARSGNNYDVINGGVGGYTLVENMIHYMTSLTELDPDLVVIYSGINDVHPRLYADIQTDYSGYRVPWRDEGKSIPTSNRQLHFSATYRFYFLLTKLLPIQMGNIHDTVSESYPPVKVWRERLAANPTTIYQSHLRNFVRLLKAQGKQVVIVPQYFDPRSEKDDVFAIGVKQNNEANWSVASDEGVGFVEEILDASCFVPDDTIDSCHFNEKGSKRMADVLFGFLSDEAAQTMVTSVRDASHFEHLRVAKSDKAALDK